MINYNLVTNMEILQTIIVSVTLYVALEMIYKKLKNR